MRCLDLFSGIGGFAVGFHAAGIETAAFCEINPYARKVLARRFPGTLIHNDITTLKGDQFGPVEIVSGGFPCQDISAAGGGGAGLSGSRSGLWWEMHRVISEAKPRFVVIENSPVLRSKGLEDVLRGLDALGYDAEWHCIPAGAVGAPHRRDRIWIVAYSNSFRSSTGDWHEAGGGNNTVWADQTRERGNILHTLANGGSVALRSLGQWWVTEPAVGRVAHGVPNRVDRLRCLGNAVVPAIPYLIGSQLMASTNP
jgi:DNA (cytosine-5)-methyltransferase 1